MTSGRNTAETQGHEDLPSLYEMGLRYFEIGDYTGAHRYFRQIKDQWPDITLNALVAKAITYYAFCASRLHRRHEEALQLCREIERAWPKLPELYLNQGRIYCFMEDKQNAVRAFQLGQQLFPHHPSLQAELATLGIRRKPIISFLARGNPLNVLLGRLSYRYRQGRQAAADRAELAAFRKTSLTH